MGLFSRRRKDAEPAEAPETTPGPEPETPDGQPDPDARGPWDAAQVADLGGRIDLGTLRIPVRPGMKLRLDVEKRTKKVVAASVTLGGSVLQVQAFAAPRSSGLWEELREEIATSVASQGGSADEAGGAFGRELLCRLPVRTADGRTAHRPVRFVGVDGPRWFLRGVISGQAAIDTAQAEPLEKLFADIVVVRGSEARAPRDVLELTVPTAPGEGEQRPGDTAGGGGGDGETAGQATRPRLEDIDPDRSRGPEITETR